jgi:uncharacterized protein
MGPNGMDLAYGPVERLYERARDGSIVLSVHLQPGAARTELVGRHGDAVKIRVSAPPHRGQANRALLEMLAETFAVPLGHISILSGPSARTKRVRFSGVEERAFRLCLDRVLAG